MSWWWSWLLMVVGVTGMFYAGKGQWKGWAIGLGGEILWVAYAIDTQQWGFIPFALAYGAVYARNALHWRGSEPKAQEPGV